MTPQAFDVLPRHYQVELLALEYEREGLKREWYRQIREKDTMTANLAMLWLALDGDGVIAGLSERDLEIRPAATKRESE